MKGGLEKRVNREQGFLQDKDMKAFFSGLYSTLKTGAWALLSQYVDSSCDLLPAPHFGRLPAPISSQRGGWGGISQLKNNRPLMLPPGALGPLLLPSTIWKVRRTIPRAVEGRDPLSAPIFQSEM